MTVATYLKGQRPFTWSKALAYEFTPFTSPVFQSHQASSQKHLNRTPSYPSIRKKKPTATEVECYYCHMKGLIVCESPALLRKREKSKPVALLGCILVGNS